MENMKSLKNKKSFILFTSFTLVTPFTPFMRLNLGWVNEGKRTPFTVNMRQPYRFPGKVNGVNRECDFELNLSKRPEFTPFILSEFRVRRRGRIKPSSLTMWTPWGSWRMRPRREARSMGDEL